MTAERVPLRAPPRLVAVAVLLLCLAGPAGLLLDRALHERAHRDAPLAHGGPRVETDLPLLSPAEVARGLRSDSLSVLGAPGPLTAAIPGAVAVDDRFPREPRTPWVLLCQDAASCAFIAELGGRLVAADQPVAGILTLPEELIDTLDRPRPRSLLTVAVARVQGRLLAPVETLAGGIGWSLALALAPLGLLLLFLPATLLGRAPADTRDVVLRALGRAARLGTLALLASAALAVLSGTSPATAVLAALTVAAAGALSARTLAGRVGAVAVGLAALPWLLGWPTPVHALLIGAAVTEAAATWLLGAGEGSIVRS